MSSSLEPPLPSCAKWASPIGRECWQAALQRRLSISLGVGWSVSFNASRQQEPGVAAKPGAADQVSAVYDGSIESHPRLVDDTELLFRQSALSVRAMFRVGENGNVFILLVLRCRHCARLFKLCLCACSRLSTVLLRRLAYGLNRAGGVKLAPLKLSSLDT